MQIKINNVSINEDAAKYFSGKPYTLNTEMLFEGNLVAIKCNGQTCGFPIWGLEISFQTFHFYFLDMDGKTLLKFNRGMVYRAENLDEPKHKFAVSFLQQEMETKQELIFRLMSFI